MVDFNNLKKQGEAKAKEELDKRMGDKGKQQGQSKQSQGQNQQADNQQSQQGT